MVSVFRNFLAKEMNDFGNLIVKVAPPWGWGHEDWWFVWLCRQTVFSGRSSSGLVDFIWRLFLWILPLFLSLSRFIEDYELIMDSDILPNRTPGSGWTTGGLDSQEPAQFEERHLIFLQLLGKVQTKLAWLWFQNISILYQSFFVLALLNTKTNIFSETRRKASW